MLTISYPKRIVLFSYKQSINKILKPENQVTFLTQNVLQKLISTALLISVD